MQAGPFCGLFSAGEPKAHREIARKHSTQARRRLPLRRRRMRQDRLATGTIRRPRTVWCRLRGCWLRHRRRSRKPRRRRREQLAGRAGQVACAEPRMRVALIGRAVRLDFWVSKRLAHRGRCRSWPNGNIALRTGRNVRRSCPAEHRSFVKALEAARTVRSRPGAPIVGLNRLLQVGHNQILGGKQGSRLERCRPTGGFPAPFSPPSPVSSRVDSAREPCRHLGSSDCAGHVLGVTSVVKQARRVHGASAGCLSAVKPNRHYFNTNRNSANSRPNLVS